MKTLEKELLFSTDDKLGRLVLQDLEHGLEIAATGEGAGPFFDVLRLKIVNGALAVVIQTHHTPKGSI